MPIRLWAKSAIDAPVTHRVGIGQRIASHCGTNPEMIELGALRAQAYFDVSKALPKGQLSEGHAQELIQAREGLHFERASIAGDATAEGSQREDAASAAQTPACLVHR